MTERYLVNFVKVQLVREATAPYALRRINDPADAVAVFKDLLGDEDREHMVAMYLNTKNRPTAISTVAVGTLNHCDLEPREVFKAAIVSNAAAVILAHNHPSGDPSPSQADIGATKRLVSAGEIVGIKVLDHVIVGEDSYVSMKVAGIM